MRILLAHNFYGSSAPSGENRAFEAERDLLRRRGHAVDELTRDSDELRSQGTAGAVRGALATPWNPFAAAAMRAAVRACRPDVVHVHNTFPLLSPAAVRAIPRGVARVVTLHNVRVFCPNALPIREGRLCTECLDRRSVLPSLRHGCYRGSRAATLPIAVNVALHRALRTWHRHADALVVLNEFQRRLLVSAGLPADRTVVKPNFFAGEPTPVPWSAREDYAVFAGRLYGAKGVEALVRAWLAWEGAPELRIVGGGPDEASLAALARRAERPIRFLGQRPAAETQALIARARLLVVPSPVFEGFPMVVCEAFAHGTPVAASDIGALASVVEDGANGVVFAAGDPASLHRRVRDAWVAPGTLERLAAGARSSFERLYSARVNHDRLMEIYELARARRRATASR
jgi:glycosyltransferase involved in cell wall biosynthesis